MWLRFTGFAYFKKRQNPAVGINNRGTRTQLFLEFTDFTKAYNILSYAALSINHLQSQQAISSTQLSCGERESDALNHWGVVKLGKQLQTNISSSFRKEMKAGFSTSFDLISLISVPSSTLVNFFRNLSPFPATLAPPWSPCIISSLGGYLLDIGVTAKCFTFHAVQLGNFPDHGPQSSTLKCTHTFPFCPVDLD